MHIFREVCNEADIHMNHMIENQTNFHKASYFLIGIQILKFVIVAYLFH